MSILYWAKPPRAETVEEWKSRSADGAPPGVYTPNMSVRDMQTWKATLVGKTTPTPTVEIRKSFRGVQVKVVVNKSGRFLKGVWKHSNGEVYRKDYAEGHIAISMNGTTYLTYEDLQELTEAVSEAREVLESIGGDHAD